jgi:hypothetical protein
VNAERLLTLLLRFVGSVCVVAVVAVFLPQSAMSAIHESAGLGRFLDQPVAEYLARATSAPCAFYGGLLLLLSRDVRRYRAVVRDQAVAIMLCSMPAATESPATASAVPAVPAGESEEARQNRQSRSWGG